MDSKGYSSSASTIDNKLGLRGVQYLIQSNLPLLKFLDLCKLSYKIENSELTDHSIKLISKSNWPGMEVLRLGKINFIEIITIVSGSESAFSWFYVDSLNGLVLQILIGNI